ncbi:NtaA/DmoA family FMN-dependent monooxygenase [Gulosibacter chungangensis]|uniref:NtaA/DmoA family FMN-dependent monooxygenase n=1 Tax=Gulosibacter chungangensis TaxID=979746 RepID=A0A7J5B963_9MICO|nr:NtaA/DmoA family FMN-dependent monooxygenase [Gulosibacter chungangensis]KAB1642151.1 NtaA/DmoA family FMN-dependent monooxygenase [Gulosibacter chungangensis]
MSESQTGHVLLGINALVLGYVPSAWKSNRLQPNSAFDADYWTQIGKTAERGTLDAVFLADGPFLGDPSYDANAAKFDPTVLWTHVAQATEHIGLISTATTSFNDPYELARRILTADYLSGGRAGWNLVTTNSAASAANYGLTELPTREDRYGRANEFADIVVGLWDSARTGERFRYEGKYLSIDATLEAPISAQGRPIIFQAGGSGPGRQIAGKLADGVFAAEITKESAIQHYREVKEAAIEYGRAPQDVKILPGLLVTLGSTEEEAKRRIDELYDSSPASYSLGWLSRTIGYDASTLPLDEPFPDWLLNSELDANSRLGSVGFRQSIFEQIRQTKPTVREYLKRTRYQGSGHGGFVGTPEQLADRIEDWFRLGAVDGFNLQPDVLLESLEVIVDGVVPILRKRGLYRHEYETNTLRGHFASTSRATVGA